MKRILIGAVLVLVVAAYLAGFWPQHERAVEAERQVQSLHGQLAATEARVRDAALLGDLLRLSDAVAAHNYGQATTLSSTYFDRIREELSRADQSPVKEALGQILQTRDQVTAALARTDPSVASTLREQQLTLRRALGYPVDVASGEAKP